MEIPIVDSFRLDVPQSWRTLPVTQTEVTAALATAADEMHGLSVADRRTVEIYLRRLVADMEAVRAEYAAVLLETFDADVSEPPVVAAVIVSVVTKQQVGSDLPLTPAAIAAAMSLPRSEEIDVLAPVRTTPTEAPALIKLPHANAVRLRQLLEVHSKAEGDLAVAVTTYMVPVPEEFERMLVVQFSTPNLADATALSELFEAIAATVRFYREGEETTL